MTTPIDLARMLSRQANDRGNHANLQEGPNRLLYTLGDDVTPKVGQVFEHSVEENSSEQVESDDDNQLVSVSIRESVNHSRPEHRVPTPAVMARRKQETGSTSFASLDAQDLPVVREYSAGGLIFDNAHRVAIIARHSRSGHLEWCLPKGHIEKGETPEQTAVREVHEETGILGTVVDSIATIDYWFTGTKQRIHKLVHHYVLQQVGGWLTVEGDPDHEAEDAIWVDFEDLTDVLSYPNERKIAWLYARKIKRA
ncbi:NUDIX hydrolase [Bombiscardovia coagulans]|uniref:NUDIX domain-containing protein n=1 Tax=Bombiscardovia coagulans TaxID=686666 RepID=A0A261ER77_9BIFI|nr:NUDIX hydrolase [Bombiscardovia coagulans]OZG49186.1 NUDIX domain-containing protein [Bombiscardovia coagulans]